jgi:predicted  nucleic acid-binding Zn-ribbon protein
MQIPAPVKPAQARRSETVGSSLRIGALLGLLMVGLLSAIAGRADAQTVSDLQTRISSAQGQAESLAADVQSKTDQLSTVRQQAAQAAAQELQLATVLAAGERREAMLQDQVDSNHAKLVRARAQLQRALRTLSQRLVAIYQGNSPDAASILLEADGYDDLATRAELLDSIQSADQSLAHRVRQLRNQVSRHLDAVQKARDEQATYNEQIASQRDQAAAARADAEAAAAQLEQARAEQAAAIESLRSQIGGWTSEVQQLQAAQAEAASQTSASQEVAGWMGDWAIPAAIVNCESGGNWGAVNASSGAGGAYQILPSTWRLYGGSGLPQDASPGEQSRIAALIWADSGPGAWECAG